MDYTALTQLIGSLGFPIACCIFLGWYVKSITDNYRADIDKMNDRHADEISNLTDTVNNNTLALQKLCDKLGVS